MLFYYYYYEKGCGVEQVYDQKKWYRVTVDLKMMRALTQRQDARPMRDMAGLHGMFRRVGYCLPGELVVCTVFVVLWHIIRLCLGVA